MSIPWFRFYSETLDDLKLTRASIEAGVDKVVILGVWAGLLALSNSSPVRGKLLLSEDLPLTVKEMALKIGIGDEQLAAIVEAFANLKMVHWNDEVLTITNWDDRQFMSDDSGPRVKRHRERQRNGESGESNKDGNSAVTLQERYSNNDVTPPEQSITEQTPEQNIADNPPKAGATAQTHQQQPKTPKPDPLTEGQRGFLDFFGAKRFKTIVQRDTVLELEQEYGTGKLLEAAKWAAKRGMNVGQAVVSVESALPKWGQPKKQRGSYGTNSRRRTGSDRDGGIIEKPPASPIDPAQVKRDRAALRAHRAQQEAERAAAATAGIPPSWGDGHG